MIFSTGRLAQVKYKLSNAAINPPLDYLGPIQSIGTLFSLEGVKVEFMLLTVIFVVETFTTLQTFAPTFKAEQKHEGALLKIPLVIVKLQIPEPLQELKVSHDPD